MSFVPPKPYASWVLNTEEAIREAPIAIPSDAGQGDPPKMYTWDEETTSWKEVEIQSA